MSKQARTPNIRKALDESARRIDRLCGMVNEYARKLGLGKKVNAEDWSDIARDAALALAKGETDAH